MTIGNRVAIYLRVSTADQSTDMQRSEIMTYVQARGFFITQIYEDFASGSATVKRPSWNSLMKDAKMRKFDQIIVWRLDRWARSLKDLIMSLHELDELGIKFISLRDGIDLSSSSGKLMFHIIAAFADFEVQIIRERVKSGLAAAKARGVTLGRPGTLDRRRIAALRADGLSLSAIAKQVGATKGGVYKTLSTARS